MNLTFVAETIDSSGFSLRMIRLWQEMGRNKKQTRNDCGHYRTRDDRRHEIRILLLSHQPMRQAVE